MALTVYLLVPSNLPWIGPDPLASAAAVAGLLVLVALQLVSALRTWTITYHAGRARDPVPMAPPRAAGRGAHHDRAGQGADRW